MDGEEDVFVNTPYMFGDELLLSGATIKYGSETTKAKGPNSSTSTISIQPHCRLIIKGTLHYSKLVATYTLTFAGEYTKTEKQIKESSYKQLRKATQETLPWNR